MRPLIPLILDLGVPRVSKRTLIPKFLDFGYALIFGALVGPSFYMLIHLIDVSDKHILI